MLMEPQQGQCATLISLPATWIGHLQRSEVLRLLDATTLMCWIQRERGQRRRPSAARAGLRQVPVPSRRTSHAHD